MLSISSLQSLNRSRESNLPPTRKLFCSITIYTSSHQQFDMEIKQKKPIWLRIQLIQHTAREEADKNQPQGLGLQGLGPQPLPMVPRPHWHLMNLFWMVNITLKIRISTIPSLLTIVGLKCESQMWTYLSKPLWRRMSSMAIVSRSEEIRFRTRWDEGWIRIKKWECFGIYSPPCYIRRLST